LKLRYILIFMGISLLPLQYEHANAAIKIGIVATVNGEMISTLDLEKALKNEISIRKIDENDSNYQAKIDKIRAVLINTLIEEKVLLLEARSQSISVSDGQLNREIQKTIEGSQLSEEDFYKKVLSGGLSKKDYDNKFRTALMTQNLIGRNVLRKIIISDDEVLDFYQSRGGSIVEIVELALIIYPSAAIATKYGVDLKSGKSNFEKVAQSVSVGPNAEQGGNLGEVPTTDLADPIQFHITQLSAGQVSNIFSLGDQTAQIMLLGGRTSTDSQFNAIDETIRMQITASLRQGKIKIRVADYIAQLKNKAIINIRN